MDMIVYPVGGGWRRMRMIENGRLPTPAKKRKIRNRAVPKDVIQFELVPELDDKDEQQPPQYRSPKAFFSSI